MPRTIKSSRLTTCEVADSGKLIRLGFLDHTGDPVSVELPFEQAEGVVMTLPRLLSKALEARTRNSEARYVFPLGHWSIETSVAPGFLIATLTTVDGFEVAFAVPVEACLGMAETLKDASQATMDGGWSGEFPSGGVPPVVN